MRTLVLGLGCACLLAFMGCSSPGNPDQATDMISGTVTLGGAPVKFATLIATGSDGKETTAQTGEDGTYQLLNPTKGKIQIRFLPSPKTRVTKPDPKVPPPLTPVPEPTPIPDRYSKAGAVPPVEYAGGRQTHDIPLTN